MSDFRKSLSSSLSFDDLDLSAIDDFTIDIVETSAVPELELGTASCRGCGIGCSCSCSCGSCSQIT